MVTYFKSLQPSPGDHSVNKVSNGLPLLSRPTVACPARLPVRNNANLLQSKSQPKYGHVSKYNKTASLAITKTSELIGIIIPFFEKYPVQGLKSLDFSDFKKVAMMIDAKEHLTIKGLHRILEIKLNMNQHREW